MVQSYNFHLLEYSKRNSTYDKYDNNTVQCTHRCKKAGTDYSLAYT